MHRNALYPMSDGSGLAFEAVTGTISYRDGSRIPIKPVTIIGVELGRQRHMGSVLPEKIPGP
jgi:hypothetical protein